MPDSPTVCPQCQAPIPPDAPGGLCPACLLAREQADLQKRQIEELNAAFPQYELIELLGRGGMGEVYKARHRHLDRLVALKILPPPFGKEDEMTARFLREARALAALNHPNIVAVHDFGEAEGLCYFAMEYIEGTDLRRLIDTHVLTPEKALAIVPQICDALQFAHESGIVHRDIKPSNILLDTKGRVKIADFGLAKIVGAESGKEPLTVTGQVVGTPFYMAPEQREHPLAVDHRADIYSLGVVFYEMLTGEIPVGRFQPPSEKVRVDVRLDEVVLKSLAKEPDRRYQQVSEVKSGVEHATAPATSPMGTSAEPPPMPAVAAAVSVPRATGKPRLSRTALLGAIWAAFGFLVLAGLIVPFFSYRRLQVHEAKVATEMPATLAGPEMPAPVPEPPKISPSPAPPPAARPAWLGIGLVLSPLLLLGVLAPFGATILGGVAIAQIRRSQGRLYGLLLAAADLLAFPLVLLFILLTALSETILKSGFPTGGPLNLISSVAVACAGCILAAWWAWRKISAPA